VARDANVETFESVPAIADFDGDGHNDVAVLVEHTTCATCTTGADYVYVFYNNGTSFSSPQQVAVANGGVVGPQPVTSDFNRDRRPDLVLSANDGRLIELVNTAVEGNDFGGCSEPSAAEGIHICFPGSGSTSSPVRFSVAANSFYPIRKLEIWVDGSKRSETRHVYAFEAWVDAFLSLGAGSHTATVVAANYDNRLIKKAVTFSVSGSTCSPPSSPGVHVCSPVDGSTVGSSVRAQAAATVTGTVYRFELWVDGIKKFSTTSRSIDTTVALTPGSHRFTFIARNTAGTQWKSTVLVTSR
jgi:hypothetical protein